MIRYLIILFLVFSNLISIGQKNCLKDFVHKTSFVGEAKDSIQMKFPLHFIISGDSILAMTTDSIQHIFLNFKIIDKLCDWDINFLQGKTTYKVAFFKKFGAVEKAIVIIDFTDKTNRFIEIQYTNGRKRFFFIENPPTGVEKK